MNTHSLILRQVYTIILIHILTVVYYQCMLLDLTVETYMFPRISDGKNKGQRNIVSFKKTHYSHTLVASFHCNSRLTDMFLQVHICTLNVFHICTLNVFHICTLNVFHICTLNVFHICTLNVFHIYTLNVQCTFSMLYIYTWRLNTQELCD